MFLSPADLVTLTGLRRGKDQRAQLDRMGIPYYVSRSGHPVVTHAAVANGSSPQQVVQPSGPHGTEGEQLLFRLQSAVAQMDSPRVRPSQGEAQVGGTRQRRAREPISG